MKDWFCTKYLVAVFAVSAALAASADLAVSSGEIRQGEWNSRFVAARDFAEANHVPMLIIFSSPGCGWCSTLRKACQLDAFVQWQQERRLVMVACEGADTTDGWECREFIRPAIRAYPYVGVYWLKRDGSQVKVTFSGRFDYIPNQKSNTLRGRLMDSVEDAISGWDPNAPVYFGGDFLATNTPSACLQAEALTTEVRVPFVRQANACGVAAVNRLIVTYPSGQTKSHDVLWNAGDRENMSTVVEVPAGTFSEVGQQIGLTLMDDKGQEVSRSVIAYAPNQENSPKNPLWIGEKAANDLAFGEWTMDLDVATNKTAATAGAAYTLVLIGGSTWCPDCVKTDAYLIDTPQFKEWARDNRISCVAIDVPKMNKDTPSLLTYDPVVTSDRYVTSTTPHQDRVQAGAGYLSRKMIEPAASAAVAARNHHLLYDSTLEGGLCRPEKMGNTFKTGIPCLIILRKDGSVAGRLDQFNDVSPDKFNPAHIDRLNELLAAAADPNEESNDDWSTTQMALTMSAPAEGCISAMDLSDVFRIEGVVNGYSHKFVVKGEAVSGETDVRASLVCVRNGVATTLKFAAGSLMDGVAVQSVFMEEPGVAYFLKVEALASSDAFSIDKAGDSTHGYSVISEAVPNPGVLSFAQGFQSLAENGSGGIVTVRRTEGISGKCVVRVAVDSSSTASPSRYDWTNPVLTWEDGESGEKSVPFKTVLNSEYEGRQEVVLVLQPVDGQECAADFAAENRHVVTIMDTDTPCFARSEYAVDAYRVVDGSMAFDLFNIGSGSVQIKKANGKLPSGMKVKVVDGRAVLAGVPGKTGTYVVSYVVKNGRVVGTESTTMTITVRDPAETNPYLGVKRKQVIPLKVANGASALLAGTLTVSVTSKGAISAKYAGSESKTLSFKGAWNQFDPESGIAVSDMAKGEGRLRLVLLPDGVLRAELSGITTQLVAGGDVVLEGMAVADVAGFAAGFDGYYTVTLPSRLNGPIAGAAGTGYLTLKIKSSGTVRYAGLVANGTSLSGSASLMAKAADLAELDVFKRTSKYVCGIPMEIRKNASETCTDIERLQVINCPLAQCAYLLTTEKNSNALILGDVYGGYYLVGQDPDSICGIFGINPLLRMEFSTLFYLPGDEGAIAQAPSGLMHATSSGFSVETQTAITSFRFDKKTGIFSGKAKVGFANGDSKAGSFKGVLLPGWFGECDECGEQVPGGLVTRPFASGLFWFKGSADGKRVVRSLPVNIDSFVLDE